MNTGQTVSGSTALPALLYNAAKTTTRGLSSGTTPRRPPCNYVADFDLQGTLAAMTIGVIHNDALTSRCRTSSHLRTLLVWQPEAAAALYAGGCRQACSPHMPRSPGGSSSSSAASMGSMGRSAAADVTCLCAGRCWRRCVVHAGRAHLAAVAAVQQAEATPEEDQQR
jgi:hypothetical protein